MGVAVVHVGLQREKIRKDHLLSSMRAKPSAMSFLNICPSVGAVEQESSSITWWLDRGSLQELCFLLPSRISFHINLI